MFVMVVAFLLFFCHLYFLFFLLIRCGTLLNVLNDYFLDLSVSCLSNRCLIVLNLSWLSTLFNCSTLLSLLGCVKTCGYCCFLLLLWNNFYIVAFQLLGKSLLIFIIHISEKLLKFYNLPFNTFFAHLIKVAF